MIRMKEQNVEKKSNALKAKLEQKQRNLHQMYLISLKERIRHQ